MLGHPGGVERVRLEVTAQPVGVAGARGRLVEFLDVVGQQVLQVAGQPHAPRASRQQQRGGRQAALQTQVHVPAQIRGVGRDDERVPVGEPVDERLGPRVTDAFTHRHRIHGQAHKPSRAGPHLVVVLGAHRAGEIEAVRAWVLVDGAAGSAEHAGNLLPFVEQHRLGQAAQRSVGVSGKRGRLRLSAQLDDRGGTPSGRGGLPRRAAR